MLVEEAVVAVPEGCMNGYHHDFEAVALETAESELLSESPTRKTPYLPDAAPAPAKSTGRPSPQAKTTVRSATETEAVGTKPADHMSSATSKKSTPSSRPAAGRPASRYVPQAEFERRASEDRADVASGAGR